MRRIFVTLLIVALTSIVVLGYFNVPSANAGEFCVKEPAVVGGYFLLVGVLTFTAGWIIGSYEMKPAK